MSGAARFPKDWQLEEFPPLALHEARKCDAVLAVQAPDDNARRVNENISRRRAGAAGGRRRWRS